MGSLILREKILSPYLSKFFFKPSFREQQSYRYIVPAFLCFFFAPYDFAWNFGNPTGLTKNTHAIDMPKNDQTAWHIRLSIAMPSMDLKDSMNTLGISPENSSGSDLLDIPDQPRPAWTENYLDLVFPHPEWGGELTDFSSDFRIAGSEKSKIESWHFQVRSNILNEEVTFSWHGPSQILARCRLRDGENGQLLVSDPLKDGYAFIMTSPIHEFIWEYHY